MNDREQIGSRFQPHGQLRSKLSIILISHFRQDDETARERTGQLTSCARAKKMKSLAPRFVSRLT